MATADTKHAIPHNESTGSLEKERLSSNDSKLEVAKAEEGVDVVANLFRGHDQEGDVDPAVAKNLRKRLDWHILPLLFLLYTLQFIDKNSLGASSILGIFQDAHLTVNQFNNLSSAFYIGYIIFVYPHAWAMQHFPIGKYIAVNIFLWAIFIGLHPLCHRYGPLFGLRFLLGASEGCITSGIMTIISMFYDRTEIGERIGWTFQCNGVATILSAMVGFGVSHVGVNAKPARWHWYMIITAGLSVFTSVAFWVWFPDNPASARFLSDEDKVNVVKRIRSSQNGIETKVWKKAQFIEAFQDPKTWLFAFCAAIANLQGGVGVQYSLIIKGFGFNTLESALLNFPTGFAMIFAVTTAGLVLRKFPNARAYIAIGGFIIPIIACILLLALPWSAQAGLLLSVYLIGTSGAGFVTIISWVAVTSAGHTKKMTVNAVFLVGYALGQMLCSQFWKAKYYPRYRVPWIIQMLTYVSDILFIIVIRWVLNRENKRRDRVKAETGKVYEEFGYVEITKEDGTIEKFKVPIALLDVTDRENEAFRYSL
jgi:MFS family permease